MRPKKSVLAQLTDAERAAGCKVVHIGETADGYVVFSTKSASERDQHTAALRLRASEYVFGRKIRRDGNPVRAWGQRRRRVSNLESTREVARGKGLL